MMTSRELVRRAIGFQRPERLPFTGAFARTDFSGDTVAVFPDFGFKFWLGGGGVDEWGCRWEVDPDQPNMGQVTNVVLGDLADYRSVRIPDVRDPACYRTWDEILSRAEREGKYVVVCNGFLLFDRAHQLHGFEDTLAAVAAEPETMQAFLRHLARYHLDTARYIHEHYAGRVHGYRGLDDWGTQTGPMISPASFAAVFQPVYSEIFDAVHRAGMDMWMHSCGQMLPLAPMLIEAGLDVLNPSQPNLYPVSKLADLRGRVCFDIHPDPQTTLPSGNRAAIASEIRELLAACCTEDGGAIEVALEQIWYDAGGISPAVGEYSHAEFRRLDPFVARN